ncbi:Mothers against decapentaplegic -like protein 6 [Toxocara canis]|uniref:Mothers against decapentaplegic homolog n=1 Tax=Toxocara canis TaxID=6265 RepID=A0A0B2UZT7_TOXCA|nr:Mothers against decapentaplegic -like protein 6 [Toxocara canis]
MPLDCGIWCLLSERRRHVEKLWRLRTIQSADEKRARRRFNRLLRAFDTEDLAAILKAVQTGGRDIKQCAPGPPMDIVEETPGCSKDTAAAETDDDDGLQQQKFEDSGLIPQIDKPMSMPYLCCKLWRWKELQVDAALHRLDPLPWCRFGRVTMNNATVSCCNPYHYALWIVVLTNDTGFGDELTGTSMANNMLPPSRAPPPLPDSLATTPVTPNIHSHASAWAHMYRWQQKERMDENGVTLRGQFVAVGLLADAVHDGQNVCIDWDIANEVSFALIRQPDPEQICEEVWLYNSGNKPLFISVSSSLNSHKAETIRRLSSGYCYRVHKFAARNVSATRLIESDPANTHYFLNISVGKGWGSNYHRIYHTDTPCRYEVIFVPDFL